MFKIISFDCENHLVLLEFRFLSLLDNHVSSYYQGTGLSCKSVYQTSLLMSQLIKHNYDVTPHLSTALDFIQRMGAISSHRDNLWSFSHLFIPWLFSQFRTIDSITLLATSPKKIQLFSDIVTIFVLNNFMHHFSNYFAAFKLKSAPLLPNYPKLNSVFSFISLPSSNLFDAPTAIEKELSKSQSIPIHLASTYDYELSSINSRVLLDSSLVSFPLSIVIHVMFSRFSVGASAYFNDLIYRELPIHSLKDCSKSLMTQSDPSLYYTSRCFDLLFKHFGSDAVKETVSFLRSIHSDSYLAYTVLNLSEYSLDLFFKMLSIPTPKFILQLESFLISDDFRSGLDSNRSFSIPLFRHKIAFLYTLFGIERATSILSSSLVSIPAFHSLDKLLPKSFPSFSPNRLSEMISFINVNFNFQDPFSCLMPIHLYSKLPIDSLFERLGLSLTDELVSILKILDSDCFHKFTKGAHFTFNSKLFKVKLSYMFIILGLELSSFLFKFISNSMPRIARINAMLPQNVPVLSPHEWVKVTPFLQSRFDSSDPINTCRQLQIIFNLCSYNYLDNMDFLPYFFDSGYKEFLKVELLGSVDHVDDSLFDSLIQNNACYWINACLSFFDTHSIYKQLLQTLFIQSALGNGSISHLLQDKGVPLNNPIEKQILLHNLSIRQALSQFPVNISVLENFKPERVTLSVQDTVSSSMSELSKNILINFKDSLNSLVLALSKIADLSSFSDDILSLEQYFNDLDPMADLDHVLNRNITQSSRRLISSIDRLLSAPPYSQNSDNPDIISCRSFMKELAQQYKNLSKRIKSLHLKSNLSSSRTFTEVSVNVRLWDRMPLSDFTLGDQVQCCLASGSSHFHALLERLSDIGMTAVIIEVFDPQLNMFVTAGINWLYLGTLLNTDSSNSSDNLSAQDSRQLCLISNYHSFSKTFQSEHWNYSLISALTDYALSFSKTLGVPYYIFKSGLPRNFDFKSFYEKSHPDISVESDHFVFEKFGGYLPFLNDPYYLLSLPKNQSSTSPEFYHFSESKNVDFD